MLKETKCLSDAQENTSTRVTKTMKRLQDVRTESSQQIETLKRMQAEMEIQVENSTKEKRLSSPKQSKRNG